ncbi:hypothetical protein LTSEWAN_0782 [Salmonella enterica subsp. enterica serovar Wandsworth str. A4-580]|uniref:Uncharacterized protein n=1 Tax=Salmonella enterica subsp. enterica serovar Wandsworth str. A4-580 TaxID=913086 RepID=G5S7I2_SALET|nr:hypothetical protein LTSEWAN_0782 [Salmonella enterica subsp. enterica serovar Wandsworth str. A4-580]
MLLRRRSPGCSTDTGKPSCPGLCLETAAGVLVRSVREKGS